MEKKCVCPADGRKFKTAAGLAQHRRDAHGSGLNQAPPRRVKAVRRQGAMVGTSTMETVRGRQSDAATMSGVDRIFHGPITTNTASGSVFCDLLITPGLFKRLAVVARAYQKIRYLSLRFRVEPQVSTTTSGGYVVAYVRDPTDIVNDIDVLTSQQGSMTTKWWQSASVSAPSAQRDFYTSDSVEVREYSPGRLVVMVDGPPTQAGSVTIFAEWSVRLMMAGLEKPSTINRDIVALADWWTQKDHVGLFTRNNGTFNDGSVASMISEFQIGDYFRVEADCCYTGAGSTLNALTFVYVKSADDLIPVWGDRHEQDATALPQTKLVVRKGTVLRKYIETVAQGEEKRPPSYVLPTTTAASEALCSLLLPLLQQIQQSSGESGDSSSDSQKSAAALVCTGKSS